MHPSQNYTIGFLVFPDMLQFDLTGAYGVLAAGPGARPHLLWKRREPVVSSDGLIVTPTMSFTESADLHFDVLCVPGGGGVGALLADDAVLAFLREKGGQARYLASVCTGALALGAAGFLGGKRATTHWQSLDMLTAFGAVPVKERVVMDGNLITGAGVSAGIDMALTLAGRLWGDDAARTIQLNMEYAPAPPYDGGTPESAPARVVEALQAKTAARQAQRREAVRAAAARIAARKEA